MNKLYNKTAIVTGAASGIGKSVTKLFLEEGANVIAVDKNESRLAELKQANHSSASALITHSMDLSINPDIQSLFDESIHYFGGFDILVNNAGIMDNFQPVAELEDDVWDRVMRINLEIPFKFMRKALQILLPKKSGVIINISSVGGLYGGRAGAAYTASKFGLIGLTKNTGYMYAKSGIRCNAIAPGGVNTHIGDTIDFQKITPLVNDRIMSGLALNPRMGEPEEIASVALFLASDESRFVNASVIVADGGWSAY
jgi:NAD(P)-dependent dehydrogenase (short-subunit alcohol dehydrogenase family)